MNSDESLLPYLTTFRHRLRLRDGWLLAQRALWIAITGIICILLIGRLVPVNRLTYWAFSPLILWLCAIAGYSFFFPLSLMRVAQRIDLELNLKERLSTALEIERTPVIAKTAMKQSSTLPNYQQKDALAIAHSIDLRQAFPFGWLPRPTLIAAGLLLVAIILVYLPNPMEVVLAERSAVKQAALEQAEEIEERKKEIEENTLLSPELQAELLRQLEDLAQQLRDNPGDREKALADLSKLEENLRRQINPNADLHQAALEAITTQLQSLAQRENGNLPSPAETLGQIAEDLTNLSAEERQELAEAFAQMAAQAAQSGDLQLAQSMAALSQATLSGDPQTASQAASAASEALTQAQLARNDQQTLQQTLSQLQNSSQSVAQAGQQGQPVAGQVPGQGNNPGEGNNPGQSNNPGQGQSGQGMSGGGTKSDTLPPGTGSGQARRPNEQDTGGATSELGEQVFVPWERRSETEAEINIPGQDTGQGETITRENPNPSGGLPGSALIPYQQVYTQYFEAAQQAIDRADIPSEYRDLVRNYFTQLEP